MRLLIFTNKDVSSNIMLNHLLPLLSDCTVGVFMSEKVGGAAQELPQQQQYLKFLEQTLPIQRLFPLIDAANSSQEAPLKTFNGLSQYYDIPFESLNDVRSAAALARIEALEPDLILSIRYGKIFGNAFVRIPKYGVINFHSGLLPQYRGVLAIFRALMAGDTSIHGTLHYIDDKTIDTGGIIGHSSLPVATDKSLLWHIVQLYPASAAFVAAHVRTALSGQTLPTQIQDDSQSAYFTFPTAAEWADFEARGHRLVDIDWYDQLLQSYSAPPSV